LSSTTKGVGAPQASLSVFDGVSFLIGIMIGIGIFRTPQLVAGNVDGIPMFIGVWIAGGVITLLGALCYAELGASRPHAGGEYHYLSQAYGSTVGLAFAWARGTVIQTGAIATVAFVYGDYASTVIPLGPYSTAIHAAIAVAVFTAINLIGTTQGKWTQHLFTFMDLMAIAIIVVAGLLLFGGSTSAAPAPAPSAGGAIGLAMVFVLLTYGGWNEAAYLSGELRDVRRTMVRTLVISIVCVMAVYLLINFAYLNVFGLAGLAKASAPGSDLMRIVAGDTGAAIVSLFICCAALSTLNATIFTGARVYSALGNDIPRLRALGIWQPRGAHPANALLLQGAIALALVLLGALTRDGFKAMVEYTAPVFWFFMLMVGLSLFVFRWRNPDHPLPYRVPLYPVTPALFCATCVFMLYSSLAYTGVGALVGVAVLLAGLPLLLLRRAEEPAAAE
jgi:basic amino acid/polyamine antiporter, APA family